MDIFWLREGKGPSFMRIEPEKDELKHPYFDEGFEL